MKINKVLVLAGSILLGLASIPAWSQTDQPRIASNGVAVVASGGTAPNETGQANRALRKKVYAAIAKHREIDAGDISVVAKAGAVTLNGTVADPSQIATVEKIARGVPGVTSVTSRLTVKKPFGGQ